jgi:hypothetical protein
LKVHILITRTIGIEASFPYYIGGRAAVLLRESLPDGSTTRRWIDPGCSRAIGKDVMLYEIIAPNSVSTDAVLSAANRAVRSEMPWIKSHQFETILFSSISCMNQDQ